jgi:hypothetical protein
MDISNIKHHEEKVYFHYMAEHSFGTPYRMAGCIGILYFVPKMGRVIWHNEGWVHLACSKRGQGAFDML